MELTATFYYCAALLLTVVLASKCLLRSNNSRLRYPPTGPLARPPLHRPPLPPPPAHPPHPRRHLLSRRPPPPPPLRLPPRPPRLLPRRRRGLLHRQRHRSPLPTVRPRLLYTKYFSYDNTSLSASPYGPHWRNLRRVTTLEIFSPARVAAFSASRSAEVRSLLRLLFSNGDKAEFRKVEMKSKF